MVLPVIAMATVLTFACNGVSQGVGGARNPTRFLISVQESGASVLHGVLFGSTDPKAAFPVEMTPKDITVCPQACAKGDRTVTETSADLVSRATYSALRIDRATGAAQVTVTHDTLDPSHPGGRIRSYQNFSGRCQSP